MFKTVIMIDIEQKTERSIIPAFSIFIDQKFFVNSTQSKHLRKIFGENYSEKLKNKQYLIEEIFRQNHTRKSLVPNFQRKEINQISTLKVGNKIFNLSSISKSFDTLLLTPKVDEYPITLSTFILDSDSSCSRSGKYFREIFTILIDLTKYEKFQINSISLYIHSKSIGSLKETDKLNIIGTQLIELKGTKQINIESGKEICSHYNSYDRLFDAISQSFCLRKCYKNYCQKRLRCSPLIIKDMTSSIDEEENELKFCSKDENDLCNEAIIRGNVTNECLKYCPKDCINFDVHQAIEQRIERTAQKREFNNKYKIGIKLFWDKNYPLISYIETPVMTFTGYLCYCGGLFGLWFGTNVNQVFTYLMNSRNWILLKDYLFKLFRLPFKMIRKLIISLLTILLKLHIKKQITLSIDTKAGNFRLESH
jgi:hypothetical protein